jgi:hypothetical protein
VLARWSGWGTVPEVFDPAREELAQARRRLAELLGLEELGAAARNTLNAHYPDAEIRHESFADHRALEGSYDLVVGNVPFGRVCSTTAATTPPGMPSTTTSSSSPCT